MSALKDIVGMTFGRLTVVSRMKNAANYRAEWRCHCSCGNEKTISGASLRRGLSQSCGCLQKERASAASKTHGESRTAVYGIWSGMIGRCENENHPNYHRWGARGIKVCARWRNSFEIFKMDMGPRPSSIHSIERRENSGHYEPGNCVWALPVDQARNTRATKLSPQLAAQAKKVRDSGGNLTAWARDNGVSQAVAWYAATGATWGGTA